MNKDVELEQIKLRKIQAMLDAAKKDQAPVGKQPIILTDSNFSEAVATNDLLIVDFWAPWCGPCRLVSPLIEQLADEYAGKAAFGKINVDENQMIARQFGVQGIPTLIVFKKGKPVETLVGAYPKTQIESKFKPYISYP